LLQAPSSLQELVVCIMLRGEPNCSVKETLFPKPSLLLCWQQRR
jgi:hypothetical protein